MPILAVTAGRRRIFTVGDVIIELPLILVCFEREERYSVVSQYDIRLHDFIFYRSQPIDLWMILILILLLMS
ncbi:hypothetical protein AK961_03600 [Serratia marcescens]|nr:hypothetical protein AK961_03600 [Serratia marcescens]